MLPSPPINNILYDTKLHKLFTKEDSTHIHKILGIFSLAHYIYRYYLLFCYGSMFFTPSHIENAHYNKKRQFVYKDKFILCL